MKWTPALMLLLAASAQELSIRTETRLVQVNVVARGHKGAPVGNLKAADLTLTENGVPQKIAVFVREWEPKPAAKLPDLPTGAASNRTGVINGATVLLVDTVNTPRQYLSRLAPQVAKFLHAVMPRDRVALYLQDAQLTTVVDFTSEPADVLAALTGRQPQRADVRLDSIRREIALAEDGLSPAVTGYFAVHLRGAEMPKILESQIPATLNTLRVISRRLSGLPGRKKLVWLTSGVPLRAGSRTFTAEFDQAMRELNAAGVTVYPASPHDLVLVTTGLARENTPVNRYSPRVRVSDDPQAGDERAMLSQTAERTGGRVLEAADMAAGGAEILADNAASYLIAYYPSDPAADGKWRKIGLRTARPGVELRYRSGYFATPAPAPPVAAAVLAGAALDALDATGIGMDVWLDGSNVKLRVHGATLPAEPQGERFSCPLEVVFVQTDRAGKQLDGVREMLPLVLSAQALQQALTGGFKYTKELKLNPRATSLRVAVRSPLTGAVGSVRLPLSAASTL